MTGQIMWCLSVFLVLLNPGFTMGLDYDFDTHNSSPHNISATFNQFAVLNCSLNFPQGNEIPYYVEWKKDNKLIFTWQEGKEQTFDEFTDRIVRLNSSQRSFGRGSINITAIRETDSGWYECKVYFPNRSPISRNNGTWFHLTIDGLILISIPPVNQTTLENEAASFTCIIKDDSFSVKWYKDNIPIANISQLATRSWIHQNGSLTINSTAIDDLGEYTCEVIDSTGHTQTASAFLDVQYKAKVIFTSERVYFPYGGSAILNCHFRSNPSLISLQWLKDGFLYVPSNVPGVYSKPNGSLHFEKVDENHAGNYSCTPTNKLGTEGPSSIMHVIVQRPPSFIIMPKSIYLKKLGDNIEFPCETSNIDGQSTIIWKKKDGSALPEDRSLVHNGSLTLKSLKEEDGGVYECRATNEAATVTTDTELMIENVPPRAPYNLAATSTDNSVTLEWAPATSMTSFTNPTEWSSSMRPFTEYKVFYKLAEVDEWKSIKASSSRTTKATISNLLPGREYEFMVLSQDNFSDGMFSKSIVVWTKGGDEISVPLREPLGDNSHSQMGPPRNLSVTLTTDGYHLSWSPPNHGLDLLRIYVVRWSQGSSVQITKTAETDNNFYLIKDLDEDEIYQFQVDSLSKNGMVVSSEKISVHVPAYGRIRAAVAGVGCILLLILIGAIVWYSRHKLIAAKDSLKKANAEN